MRISIPSDALGLLAELEKKGYEAWLVGGCVRDFLLGREPLDWDIATCALPQQTMACFEEYPQVLNGLRHGTVMVIVSGRPYEITTYRSDGDYADGRHPRQVTFIPDIREDLSRRDFTVNAMAYHPSRGLLDLFCGQEDLNNRLIRCVGDAGTRFEEDALRILRGLRFAACYGFTVEAATLGAMKAKRGGLGRVSKERISSELTRMLCGPAAAQVTAGAREILSAVIPQVADWGRAAARLTAAMPEPVSRLAALLGGMNAQTAGSVTARLRLDNKTKRDVLLILSVWDWTPENSEPYLLNLLNRVGAENARRFLAIQGANDSILRHLDALLAENACFTLSALAVKGQDLPDSGKAVGRMLRHLLDEVMSGRVQNEKNALLMEAERYRKTLTPPV